MNSNQNKENQTANNDAPPVIWCCACEHCRGEHHSQILQPGLYVCVVCKGDFCGFGCSDGTKKRDITLMTCLKCAEKAAAEEAKRIAEAEKLGFANHDFNQGRPFGFPKDIPVLAVDLFNAKDGTCSTKPTYWRTRDGSWTTCIYRTIGQVYSTMHPKGTSRDDSLSLLEGWKARMTNAL